MYICMYKASVETMAVPHAGEAAGGRIGFEDSLGSITWEYVGSSICRPFPFRLRSGVSVFWGGILSWSRRRCESDQPPALGLYLSYFRFRHRAASLYLVVRWSRPAGRARERAFVSRLPRRSIHTCHRDIGPPTAPLSLSLSLLFSRELCPNCRAVNTLFR
jgi:hypothetical protein